MNDSRRVAVAVTLLAAGFIFPMGPVCKAQTQGLTPVPPPATGTFYSLQFGDNWPPLPFLPFDVPVYDLGDGIFGYDDLTVDYVQSRSARQAVMLNGENDPPDPEEGGDPPPDGDPGSPGFNYTTNDLWLGILTVTNSSGSITVTLTIHAPDTNAYDLFRTFELVPSSITNALWRWVGRGTNAQSLSFSNVHCPQAFYVLGSRVDTDGDTLTDAFEMLVSKTSPATNRTYYSTGLTDLEWWLRSNVLVNDPEQDCANEQNSQFETTVVVVGNNVIVAWVDSNQGVYDLGAGANGRLTNYTPRMVGYAVSRDGGVTFEDKGVPPLSRAGGPTNTLGDAGDPVLAVDRVSGSVYLAGTSPRNDGYKGIPLWKSTDGGVTFATPVIVRDEIIQSDKPWIAVDDWEGTGQHDVYLGCIGKIGTSPQTNALWLTVSTDGYGTNWSSPVAVRQRSPDDVSAFQSLIPVVGPGHVVDAFWFESTGPYPYYTNWLKMRQVLSRGAALGEVQTICRLVATNNSNGNLDLLRSNSATNTDTFRVFPFPVPAVNPVKTNHVYVAYADRGTNTNDGADAFFTLSTNAGTNWTSPQRVNTDATTNDQWMPVLCVKPDGTQLFMAWYDRRNDMNNSLIDLYGRFATIATNGSVTFGTEFTISTTNFPPVFAGTDTNNLPDGHYDPVYPPGGVNLHWYYADWPTNAESITFDSFKGHVGEYNAAFAEEECIYMSWTDYRLPAAGTLYHRNQSDIRFVRISWP